MDTQTILQWQQSTVAELIKEAGFSVSRIATETGIPHTTLLRKLKGVSEFKPSELFRIAKVTHLDPALFIPPQFSSLERAA
ncbi:helix-turn-helix domain-containing protein [Bifidobacterium crudilactis]|jgi:transcriptional regulator with XRE-family HTH domain|uniref:helix-turn-helix domain-containing protein n=1 Tax=Bifidobacterium crudilactis TaxID=327277 RepID=UPI002649F461|nr:helix-turn-helix transcriptional regulator [Bifidobacterium crudilactis]MDN5973455.1 helix-turn-helix domain-containing protein [Bifidobacterium crudilactis]MDN6559297.1 helix-turn-helix domain-containing protein [Bifidobacterium crudilactis]MDN6585750.1 helix-turn-helix domain-containing protein [Bifidobacterium crudilactis]MDN6654364.1 helix-turn-helix domain-containing protein [Bifidobacterium crudilactis]MDN6773361.1 helix-turn-helix domain-containing protein [Bifidobacterium crudilacti